MSTSMALLNKSWFLIDSWSIFSNRQKLQNEDEARILESRQYIYISQARKLVGESDTVFLSEVIDRG